MDNLLDKLVIKAKMREKSVLFLKNTVPNLNKYHGISHGKYTDDLRMRSKIVSHVKL